MGRSAVSINFPSGIFYARSCPFGTIHQGLLTCISGSLLKEPTRFTLLRMQVRIQNQHCHSPLARSKARTHLTSSLQWQVSPKKIYPVLEIGTVPLGLVNRLSTLDDPGPYRGNRHHRRCRRSGMNACGNSENASWPKNGAGARCNCFMCTKSIWMIKRTTWYMIYVCV